MTMPGATDGVFRREDAERIRQFQVAHASQPAIGAEVVATVTATVVSRNTATGTLHLVTPAGGQVMLPADGDVNVVELEPERLTLEDVLAAHVEDYDDDRGRQGGCSCGKLRAVRAEAWEEQARVAHVAYIEHVAAEVRAAGLAR